MFKRIIGTGLAVLALGVAGCGGNDDKGSGGGDAGAPKATTGFDGKTISLGVVTPLTGPVAVIGKPLTSGNEVFFKSINAAGGIAGKYKVKLVQADSQYKPDVAVQQYNKLKNDVAAFTQILGTPSVLAVLPQLKRDKIIGAPASLDATWVPEQNLMPIGGPYQIQAINALDYYVNEDGGKGKTVCSMIQDDAYGEAGQEGLDFGASKLGVDIKQTGRFKVGDKDVTGQIQGLQKAKCDMVFLVATPSDAGTIWGTAAKLGFAPRWIGQSPTWIDELGASPLKDYLAQTTLIISEGTEWGDTKVPGMAKMVEDVAKFAPKQQPDYYFAFGYNQGRAIQALLEKGVELGDLSRDGLLKASEELGTVSFGGLTGDYGYGPASERKPPRASTLFKVNPKKPFGLETQKYNFKSPVADEFNEFGA